MLPICSCDNVPFITTFLSSLFVQNITFRNRIKITDRVLRMWNFIFLVYRCCSDVDKIIVSFFEMSVGFVIAEKNVWLTHWRWQVVHDASEEVGVRRCLVEYPSEADLSVLEGFFLTVVAFFDVFLSNRSSWRFVVVDKRPRGQAARARRSTGFFAQWFHANVFEMFWNTYAISETLHCSSIGNCVCTVYVAVRSWSLLRRVFSALLLFVYVFFSYRQQNRV